MLERARSIQARLAVLILVAMAALVVLLIYQEFDERSEDRREAREDLQRLATFAARAERTRFQATENLLGLATGAQALRQIAFTPDDTEARDACTRSLFTIDQILPGTLSTMYDTSGSVLCSSRAAERGAFSAAGELWFETAVERQAFSTGGFRTHPQTGDPGLNFGLPIRAADGTIVGYLSTLVIISEAEELIAGDSLPPTGRITIVDANNVVINSSELTPGEQLPALADRFAGLTTYLSSGAAEGNGRTGAAVRITDADDAAVLAIVSAETDSLVPPLTTALIEELLPVAIVTVLALGATMFLARIWVVRPVGALVRATDSFAHGDLGTRAQVPSGVTEFEQLGESFNDMARMRERASHAKDEFLGLVSHELKTPITTVLGNAEILRTRADRIPADLRQTALDDIHDSAVRLTAIIDNLLVLARLDRGAALDAEPLPLLRMAQAYVEEQARVHAGEPISVRGDNGLLALGGETNVEQVIRNLIGNAIKYSAPGEPVEVIVEQADGMARFRVLDRGAGIEPGEREAIFEPFYRSASTASVAEGMGIGLSVCKRLIEAMGGEIWSKDREGGGSEFGFSLPLVIEESLSELADHDRVDDEELVTAATS